jgi:hypothetical protein
VLFGTSFEKYQIEISYLLRSAQGHAQQAKPQADQVTPEVSSHRSKIMKTLKSILCAATLVLAISAPTLAKTGIISTTRTGIISTTRTGIISTTKTGPGTISTTRTGIISTTRAESTINSDRFWVIELLLTVVGPW